MVVLVGIRTYLTGAAAEGVVWAVLWTGVAAEQVMWVVRWTGTAAEGVMWAIRLTGTAASAYLTGSDAAQAAVLEVHWRGGVMLQAGRYAGGGGRLNVMACRPPQGRC